MLDYPNLRAVAMVVETGSFEKAAAALNITPSAVSQRVKQIEERLGTVLVVRGTPCTATEKGAFLCRHMQHVGMLEAELYEQLPALIEPDAPRQKVTLNIATNADSLGTWLLEALSAVAATSDYLFNIAVDDQDYTADWLRRGRVLGAVTSHAKPVQGCRVTPLGILRFRATASPDFLRRHFAAGVTASAISHAPSLTFDQKDRLQVEWVKRVLGENIACPTHWLPSTHGFIEACVSGMGWGMNPAILIDGHIAAGRLVELVEHTPLDVPLYWQVNRLAAERLADLSRAIIATARRCLTQPETL